MTLHKEGPPSASQKAQGASVSDLRLLTLYIHASLVECWLFESKYKSHQPSQSFRIDSQFLKNLVFIFLGPNAGPDGLIPWTRFCKVGAVSDLHSECFLLSVGFSDFSTRSWLLHACFGRFL